MDAREHLFYGLGIIAYSVARADGSIQTSEKEELHELIRQWSEQYDPEYDVSEIIFLILKKNQPSLREGFEMGMNYIRLGSHHLTAHMKEHFVYLIRDVAHAFPPVTHEEESIIREFKLELEAL